MPHHDAPYGSHPNDANGTPQPEDVEVPEHIKTIQSLSSATRNPDVAVHFGTMMFKNLKIKLRTPVSCCLETLLPVIFVLGLMFIWLAVTEGTVPNTHYLKVDQPNITTIPVQTAIDKYACIKSGNAAVVGIRSCTSAEEANTTHPLFCYAYPTVPVRGLCTTIDGQSIALQWLDFKMTRFVPSIDEMIFMQWLANATFTYRMKDNGYQQPLGGLANGGKLNFAPDSSTVRNFIAHLNTTSNLFRHSIGRVFPSSDEAASFVSSNDQADRNWGVVVFDKFDASGLDVTIRMNRSGVPWTNQIIEIGNGNGQFRTAQYMSSGFITLQDAVSRYYIQTFTSGPLPAPTVHTPMPFISYDTSAFLVIIGGLASLFLVFGYLYPVSQLVKRIVEEKEQRVREAMMIMGLATGPFYCSWVVTYFIIQFFTALLAAIILKATMFPKSDFFIQFLLYFLFGISNITLSSCMSAFFSKSRIAALVAPVVFFIFSIPSFALPSTTPAGVLIILSLMGPTAFANGMNNLVNQEITGGSTWTNINKSFNDYPISVVFVMLAIDTILYMLLTLYFDAVLPSEWGVRTHPLFCCVNPYRWWKSRQQDKANADEEMKDGRDPTGAFEPTTPGVKPSVELRGLRKEFVLPDGETMVAVNDLTFNMYENQVFALLGHNGAGKTTAMNLMTGMLELDGGDCFFHGYSVRHDIEKVRREIGYCPQHNILWAELTCREHLDFFARLKGLDSDTRPKAVEAMLKAVDLEEKGDKFPHELSGGQKRKLSVGIAFVGGSKVVFLDEPTAGMDVAARRHTWELIKMMTPGRTIVLTTHYMDEADLLGNTIAVMAKGRLKCAGSSLFLKSRLGVGYNLNIAVGHGATNSQQIIDGCRQFVPTLDILANGGGEIGLRLPMESAPQFPNLLSFLEDSSAAFGIRGHGISVTTLEEIFLKIGHDDEHAAEDAKKAKKGSAPSTANSDVAAHSAIVEPDQVAIDVSPTTDPDADKLMWTDEISQAKGTAGGQFSALFAKRFHYAKRDTRTIVMQAILPVVCITFAMLLTLIKFPDAPKFTFGNPANYQGATETVFANCPAGWTDYVSPIMHTDAKVTSTVALDQFLFTNFQKHVDNRIGAYMCNDVNAAPVTPVSSFFTNNTIYRHSAPHTLNEFHGDYIRNMRKEKIDIKFSTHPVPLSNYESAFIDAIVTLFVAIFVLIPFTFVPSTFVSFIVKEREVRALQLQRASGMMYGVYWCANYLFDTCSFVITALLAITIFAIFGRNEYIGDGELFGAIFLLLMLYGCASVAGSYISSFFFDSHSTAQNIVMLVNFICGFMLVLLAYILTIIDSTEEAGKILKYFFRVVPAYCLGEGILNMADRKLKASFGVAPAVFSMEVVGWPMLYLGLEIPIFCLIVIYLDSPLRRAQAHAILDDSADTAAEHIENEDEDVLVERNEIESGSRDTTDLVVVKNLRKFYPSNGGVLAVKNLSFGVHKGEVFGFLGTNGAGKTTTISILCGDQMPSRGQGWIAGCDVVNDAAKARSLIGYCPQFDALHDLLTVEEHLNLYAGLHGLTGQLATDVTERLIRVCDLQEHRVKESRSLSGGNKRKLSVAISLLGAPQVVFLDEPSAGMDPMARRTMWSVIEQIAEHCSVVLTTHHLEEIEALSSRMGIMVDGELKCIGPLQHLKTKFGSGFEMSIRVRPEEKAEAAEAFFHGQLPDAHLQEKRSGKLTYALPQSTKLSVVFKLIEDNKTQFSITDYSVSQTSLETVFLRISADAKNTGD